MPKPERYQMGFDFRTQSGLSAVRYELSSRWQALLQRAKEVDRFTRVVKEEIVLRTPQDTAAHLLAHVYVPCESCTQEELWTLLMNNKHRITHEVMVYRGTVQHINVRLAELFKAAVRVNAPALLLSHSHPSGSVEPSPEDQQLNELALQAGELLGIEIIDHIVVGDNQWLSMREQKIGGFE